MKKKIKSITKVSLIIMIIMIRGMYKNKNSRANNTTINMMREIETEIEETVITENVVVPIKTTMMTPDMVVKISNITKKNTKKNH
jgi:hypothetical protein